MSRTLRLVVLVSGSGTNLQALLDAAAAGAPFTVLAVGADRDGTRGEERARRAGIPTFVTRVPDYDSRADWDLDLRRRLGAHDPDLVVSAGFMKLLGPAVLAAHPVLNTHPALLPSFPGAHAVRDALAHGVRVTGCTCHWVDDGVDTGPIVDQRAVHDLDPPRHGGGHAVHRPPPEGPHPHGRLLPPAADAEVPGGGGGVGGGGGKRSGRGQKSLQIRPAASSRHAAIGRNCTHHGVRVVCLGVEARIRSRYNALPRAPRPASTSTTMPSSS